jgi:hypothetical protein
MSADFEPLMQKRLDQTFATPYYDVRDAQLWEPVKDVSYKVPKSTA